MINYSRQTIFMIEKLDRWIALWVKAWQQEAKYRRRMIYDYFECRNGEIYVHLIDPGTDPETITLPLEELNDFVEQCKLKGIEP